MSQDTHDSHSHHITPPSTYLKVFVLLVIGMAATIGWALFAAKLPQSQELTFLNNIIAMGIAVGKATLVIAFFMGVKYSSKLVRFYALLGFAWVGFIGFTFCDYATRAWEPVPGWEKHEVSYPTQVILPARPESGATVPHQQLQHSPRQP
ncbi:MAG: cytochrome C oxidase subunit IV family protein [Fimbriimonadaceae bacterium]|nr:cytochrome C oxidase subunit IV family protein [Fimbriimonadaceae bacterium]